MSRLLRLALLPAAVAFGLFAEWASLRRGPFEGAASSSDVRLAALDFVVGLVLVGCGVVVWDRRPESWIGALLAATGLSWFLGTFAASGWPGFSEFGSVFVTLHRGPLPHALLAYPSGRVMRRIERTAVAGLYGLSAVAVAAITPAGTFVTAGVLLGVAGDRYLRSTGPERRARSVAAAATTAFSAVLVVAATAQLAGAGTGVERAVLWAYEIVVLLIALTLTLDLLRRRWTKATVAGLVVDLGSLDEDAPLRGRLAAALGDPSLEIGYRVAGRDAYVDDSGRVLALPDAHSSRAATIVRENHEPVAALVHDSAVLDDPQLLDSVAAAMRIAVANARLQSEVRSQLAEIERSRRRIVEAGDRQRQRLEHELHEGAERRLAEVSALLEQTGDGADADVTTLLEETRAELGRAQAELKAFARGIHPRALTEGGLAAALPDLARSAPLPVELEVADARFPAHVEVAAYFVCSEALANIGKYAEASHAAIEVGLREATLVVSVEDDGRGGASLEAGSGLRGLADRVEALGGRLELESPPGDGTRLLAELPLT